tara:strand:- start:338 stop:1738 length:1401 start_codon:yes stop_codon:yes gene_type:complete
MKINIYSKNIIISSIPGFISIVLSFFSIPIYLNYLGLEKYGNFLILHIFLTIVMITNFNLGKIASIKMQKFSNNNRKSIISTTIFVSFIASFFVSSALYIVYLFAINHYSGLVLYNDKLFFFALFISNIYVNLENICKGVRHYYLSSVSNLIFYSFSLSMPALFIISDSKIYGNIQTLFEISIFFKILSIFLLIITFAYKKFFNSNILSELIIKDFILYSKWQTLSSTYVQIFDFFDKYLIKIFLGAANLTLYSIPQQIAGKLSILSDAIIAVFIPRISSRKTTKDILNIFNSNFYIFFYLIGISLIIINPFLDEIIKWWLGKNINLKIIYLFKIFLLVSFYICITHIISTFFDTQYKSKKNSQIETIILIFFIFGLVVSVYYKDINYFAYTILLRAMLTFVIKAIVVRKNLINFKMLIIQNLIFCLIFLFSILENYYLFYISSIIFITMSATNVPLSLIKKEFLK